MSKYHYHSNGLTSEYKCTPKWLSILVPLAPTLKDRMLIYELVSTLELVYEMGTKHPKHEEAPVTHYGSTHLFGWVAVEELTDKLGAQNWVPEDSEAYLTQLSERAHHNHHIAQYRQAIVNSVGVYEPVPIKGTHAGKLPEFPFDEVAEASGFDTSSPEAMEFLRKEIDQLKNKIASKGEEILFPPDLAERPVWN